VGSRIPLLSSALGRAYLAEISDKVRAYDRWVDSQLQIVREHPHDAARLDPACVQLLEEWSRDWQTLSQPAAGAMGSDSLVETPNGLRLPRVALPDQADRAESLRFLLEAGAIPDGEIAAVETRSIGAGGGSLAWLNQTMGNLLEVGPQSDGGMPGPAAYNLGGTDRYHGRKGSGIAAPSQAGTAHRAGTGLYGADIRRRF